MGRHQLDPAHPGHGRAAEPGRGSPPSSSAQKSPITPLPACENAMPSGLTPGSTTAHWLKTDAPRSAGSFGTVSVVATWPEALVGEVTMISPEARIEQPGASAPR